MKVFAHQVRPDSAYYLPILSASHWFWKRGYEIETFQTSSAQEGALDVKLQQCRDETIVRATPEMLRLILRRLGFAEPPLFELPPALNPWIGRFTWETTLGQVREQVDSEISLNPFHIRPLDHRRQFKGTIVYGLRDLIPSASLADETPVLAQQKIEFVSEWRAFVLRGKVLHVAHLKGSPLRFPDAEVILAALGAYTDRPIAFGMDWGITAAGQTMLIEINDGYSYGHFGMHGMMHTAMIEARWRELVGLTDNGIGDCFTHF
jgi:hypothetical protein